MKKIAIIGHGSIGSCLISVLEHKLNAQGVELVINNKAEDEKYLRVEPLPFVITETFKENVKITEPERRKFIDKPRFNFKK